MDLWTAVPLVQMEFLEFPRAKKPLGVQFLSRVLGKTLN
jgi:hypothetical protein